MSDSGARSTDVSTGSEDIAISVEGVSKFFELHSDRRTNLKERFVRGAATGDDESKFWALRDVGFQIPRGSTYGLIGHNGSGKSTMLKLLAGIHRPSSGKIAAAGRLSSMIELGAGFHPELSGRENIYLNGSILGLTRKQIDATMDEIIDFSGIETKFIDSPVKVYSSGMYVRLGFAIAVNLDPEILLIDEIVAVGDEEFQRKCFDHLYKLRRKGVTIVFVSHSLPLVQTLCDHALWLDHGVTQAEGKAVSVVDEYLQRVNQQESERLAEAGDTELGDQRGRRGSGEITITRIEFLDATGVARPVANTGEPVTVRMHVTINDPVDEPVFGLAFHHESGQLVSGPNSQEGAIMTGRPTGDCWIDFRMEPLLLQPGAYVVSASAVDTSLQHIYDYRDQAFSLHVQPGRRAGGAGFVEMPGSWSLRTNIQNSISSNGTELVG